MPMLFDFRCTECDNVKEYLVKNSTASPEECSNCGASTDKLEKRVCYNKGGFFGLPMSSKYGRTDKYK